MGFQPVDFVVRFVGRESAAHPAISIITSLSFDRHNLPPAQE